ncbi:MAG: nuclear transport factor 2 family protein [Cytophagales bacterium]
MSSLMLQAQDKDAEEKLVRAAVYEYIEGRNNGDVERLKNAFLPNASLKGVSRNKEQSITPIADYVAKQTPGRKHDCTTEVRLIDFVKDVAVAHVVLTYSTHSYHDYLILMKIGDRWKIADKIYTRIDVESKKP